MATLVSVKTKEGWVVMGIPEFSRDLANVNADLSRELVRGFYQIADHVTGVAQQKMPWQSGTAARSLKPEVTMEYAAIVRPKGGAGWKDDTAGYYNWLDWGGSTGRGHRDRTAGSGAIHRDWRGPKGRFLYPALGESKGYIQKALDAIIERLFRGHGFEVRL
jgi:hypothetical protein